MIPAHSCFNTAGFPYYYYFYYYCCCCVQDTLVHYLFLCYAYQLNYFIHIWTFLYPYTLLLSTALLRCMSWVFCHENKLSISIHVYEMFQFSCMFCVIFSNDFHVTFLSFSTLSSHVCVIIVIGCKHIKRKFSWKCCELIFYSLTYLIVQFRPHTLI